MGRKLIFMGCLSSKHYPDTCENATKLIQSIDDEYEVLDDVPCCGALAYHITKEEKMKEHVNFVNDWFQENDIDKITTICAGCYQYLTRYYPKFLGDDFQVDVEHLLQFLAKPENLNQLNLEHEGKKIHLCYHDGCHLRNAVVPIIEEPRTIINSIKNIKLYEMENNKLNSICCGSGGGVYSIFKENSDYNTQTIFDQMRRGKILLTGCPFCYTAFQRVKKDNNVKKIVLKIEDFLMKIINGVDPLNE